MIRLIDPQADDPNLANVQAYFGANTADYAGRSPINHVKSAPAIPTFIVVAEYDNPDLDTQGAVLWRCASAIELVRGLNAWSITITFRRHSSSTLRTMLWGEKSWNSYTEVVRSPIRS